MELRDIEIFLTLAQELHFGRTAERLHITPARVSQSIKQQERRIGTALFERSTRRVRLTPAGRQLQRELDTGYRQIMNGIAAVSAAARGATGTLRLGTMGPQAWMVGEIVELFRTRYPDVHVDHRDINPVTPLAQLRSGEVDVAHLWLPVHEPDLTTGPITHTSPILLMLADSHPYAGRSSLCLEDYGDLTFVSPTAPVPAAMEEAFQPFRTPAGRPIPRGPSVSSWDDQVKAVVSGQAVLAVPAEAARFYAWPNLTYVPVRDAPPVQWAFAWRTAAETPQIRAFAQAAQDHRTTS
ncbi:LysR family transcriptional regulator [Saccharothrix variisporea]|uniref:LysR family transcriptional regulator n=1 Tax=Saccharothrix variisporea TaxID=543527 RepID=A0A495X1Q7_9PSEU|nr:LysR family transcriptional regulator [Saccharothrix variisporea]RKT67489.1 LysR family transcriptional regulator [Saccharothrix variisporea]